MIRGHHDTFIAVALTGAMASLAGCSSVLGIETDRHLVAASFIGDGGDAADAGPASTLPEAWACFAKARPALTGGTVTVSMIFNDPATAPTGSFVGKTIAGISLRACNKLDPACASPVTLQPSVSDANGMASLVVPQGFDGYYEATSSVADGWVPLILARPPEYIDATLPVAVVQASLFPAVGSVVGITIDPTKGNVTITNADCNKNVGQNVTYTTGDPGPSAKFFYLVNAFPNAAATSTDSSGAAVLLNVSPGNMIVHGLIAGQEFDSRTAFVRAGWHTEYRVGNSVSPLGGLAPDGGR